MNDYECFSSDLWDRLFKIDLWMFFQHSRWFWSSSSILAADCAGFSKPANNVHKHLRDGALLKLKYCLNILCVATTELEVTNSSNILTPSSVFMLSLVFHFGWIWYQFLNYSVEKNWKFIPKLLSIIQSPNFRVWFKTKFNIISFISLKLSTI